MLEHRRRASEHYSPNNHSPAMLNQASRNVIPDHRRRMGDRHSPSRYFPEVARRPGGHYSPTRGLSPDDPVEQPPPRQRQLGSNGPIDQNNRYDRWEPSEKPKPEPILAIPKVLRSIRRNPGVRQIAVSPSGSFAVISCSLL